MLVASIVTVLLRFFANPEAGFLASLFEPRHWAPQLIALAVTLPIATLQLVKFSHRFAGPVHRLRSEMRSLAEKGSAPPLRFRQGDYWLEMADEFNAIADLVAEAKAEKASMAREAAPLELAGGSR